MKYLSTALYHSSQIREVERIAIEELHISGLQLMQRAGQAAFRQLQQRWPRCRQVRVFCGAGNNGGDGYVIALLALQAGYQAHVHASAASLPEGDALEARTAYLQAGGRVECFTEIAALTTETVLVDALLGTGLNRPPSDEYAAAIAFINAAHCPVLAVDVPSGLHADTGCVMGSAVHADLTVTFIGLKCGLHTGLAADYRGDWRLAGLDLPEQVYARITPAARLLEKHPLPPRPRAAHKGRFGHVLLIGGNLGYSGAIRLAAEAALRSGAGLVSVATRAVHSALLNLGRPELMCHGVENALQLQPLLSRVSVVVIGPGLGQDAWADELFAAVATCGKPCVMDADALNLLARQPFKAENRVLTPHPGEAARLLSMSVRDVEADRFAALAALHERYGGVCVLKGAGSLIGDGLSVYVATTGNPGMASGGMGDVLAGVIGGLLAQNQPPPAAAALGVYAHGEAADRVAARQGEQGMLAGDLFSELGACLCAE
ncbi:MAG: NAD(P)H-hydrate dehydratase [Methylococcales bacterium]|nr:NAD(P)H-hydrate dehydratase [Methylococcales bacterium]